MPPKERSKEEIEKFLQLAQDRFKLSAEAESEMRAEMLDDLEFSIGDQWPADIKADRQINGRPCLTVNVLPQFIRQVTNDQRQQRPSINVNPVGNGADVDTGEIFQGITRHIEVLSDAEVSYDYATEYMVRIGMGWWRIISDYASDDSEEQDLFIQYIRNPFSVYDDPNACKPDRSDRNWLFIVEDIPESEFKRLYPNSQLGSGCATLEQYSSIGDNVPGWASTSGPLPTLRVAEYFHVERTGRKSKVEWAKISALDVLDEEETIFDKYIPVVGVYGDDLIVNGKRHVAGLVRFAKDPQRAKNFWTSAATEMIALAPKAPFVGAVGQFKTKQEQWEQANYRNQSYLEYDMVASGGQQAPPPQRNSVEPPIQAMNAMLQMAQGDLSSTTGLYPANLGKQQNTDESGKAVIARKQQGELSTLNFSDNLARAIRLTGRILVKAIPKVYTAPKVQRIIKPDNSVSHVGVFNSQNDQPQEAHGAIAALDPDIKNIYDIGVGEYDVTVSVGPSYQTKRQEAVATQMAIIQADPQLMGIIGDILTANMDIPGAQEISKRLKKLLPPQLQDQGDQTPEAQLAQAQGQLQQLGQQHQQLVGALQQAQQIINTKQVEMQSRLEIEKYKANTDLMLQKAKIDAQIAIAEINTKSQSALERAKMFQEVWTELHGSSHELAMQKDQQQHEQSLAQQAAAQQAQAQQSDQAASAQSQQSDQAHEAGMAAVNQEQQAE